MTDGVGEGARWGFGGRGRGGQVGPPGVGWERTLTLQMARLAVLVRNTCVWLKKSFCSLSSHVLVCSSGFGYATCWVGEKGIGSNAPSRKGLIV